MSLRILERSTTPDGVSIQLESWDGKYGIGAYPKAKNDFGYTRKRDKTFRLGLTRDMPDNDKVKTIYLALIDGTARIEDYERNFWYGNEDSYTLGLTDICPRTCVPNYIPSNEGTPYEFKTEVDGEEVYFGFDGKREMSLWGGSFGITYPKQMTLHEVIEDIKTNYKEYKQDDLEAHYRAWGYWD